VDNYIDSKGKLRLITDIGAAIKSLLTTVGLFAACVLAGYAVIYKSGSPGDFVVLLTYWNRLQGI
jgi:ABC-type multidrug transport system fused ATPase/permease subunit